jgi:GNAT superfamily N-acetyltransferase
MTDPHVSIDNYFHKCYCHRSLILHYSQGGFMAQEFKAELLPPAIAGDMVAVSGLTDLVNQVYARAEDGLWIDGATRTSVADMAAFVRSGELAVAIQDERLLGCVRIRRLDDEVSEFGMLAVDPGYRGTGIGRELVRFAERQACTSGCGVMQLELLVPRQWKHPSKEFLDQWYTRIGYAITGTGPVAEFYPDLSHLLATPCDFRIYRKKIGAGR